VDGARNSSRLPCGQQHLDSTSFASLDSLELLRRHRCWIPIFLHFCLSRRVTTLDSAILGKRGGREWQTRSNTCRSMLTSGNAKPGEEREEGED